MIKTTEDMATKNLTTRRNEIISKIRNLSELKEERSSWELKTVKNDGTYNFDAVDKYLKIATKVNRAQGVIKRMIKSFMNDLYNGWSFENDEYLTVLNDFNRFGR
ncbi:MAG: hypothetical protein ACLUVC_14160 [Longibaculum sp.]|jgi:hypothetical protein